MIQSSAAAVLRLKIILPPKNNNNKHRAKTFNHIQSGFSFFSSLCQGMVNCSRRYPVAGCLSGLPQATNWSRGNAC